MKISIYALGMLFLAMAAERQWGDSGSMAVAGIGLIVLALLLREKE